LHAKRIEGVIISKHDTTNVIFNIPFGLTGNPSYTKIQNGVKYFKKGKKVKLSPDDNVKEIQFESQGELIRILSINRPSPSGSIFNSNAKSFLKLEKDGNLKLFTVYVVQHNPGVVGANGVQTGGGKSIQTVDMLMNEEGNYIDIPLLSYRKRLAAYFSNCPQLANKIKNKEFRKSDVLSIVKYYNNYCE